MTHDSDMCEHEREALALWEKIEQIRDMLEAFEESDATPHMGTIHAIRRIVG